MLLVYVRHLSASSWRLPSWVEWPWSDDEVRASASELRCSVLWSWLSWLCPMEALGPVARAHGGDGSSVAACRIIA